MMNKKILILMGENNWITRSMTDTGLVDVFTIYRDIHGISKLFFKLRHCLNHSNKSQWYNPEWAVRVSDYKIIILFDAFDDSDIVEYICRKAPNARLIIYYYNMIKRVELLDKIKALKCEIWSFDKNDVIKYKLKYNPQFYFRKIDFDSDIIRDFDYKSDVFFVGKDKNRLSSLMNIDMQLKNSGIQTKFIVVGDRQHSYTNKQKRFLGRHISYAECIEYVKHTKCIFDMVQKGQKGMTLRVVEAMFFNKKLITNNDNILYMDFYNSQNIYVIGHDNRSMSDFILQTRARWPEKFIHEYSFENWLNNFMNGEK
ncbi:MAG: hypothetical protein ACI4N8_06505 [Megasphaera sp.]|uniref:hypothetical protein n=1 Tax=Megasphaera sp. TaxID=2023260 RepID=UPI003EFE75FE